MQRDHDESGSMSNMDYVNNQMPPPVHDGFVPAARQAAGAAAQPQPSSSERTWNPGGWNKGLRMPAVPPSDEFNDLYTAALNAFIAAQIDEPGGAFDLIQQAIALNPEVYAAHVLLSEIYLAKNDEERAVATLFTGAHAASRETDVWKQVADSCLQHNTLDHNARLKQAAYCYTRALDINRKDHDSRFHRASINAELGYHVKALRDLETILRDMPHNPSVLKVFAEICIESRQIPRAKLRYEECIEYYKTHDKSGFEAFTWSDIVYYAELFVAEDQYDEAIFKLKQLARWLAGREEEDYWDLYENDDREWDAEDQPRRDVVQYYTPGRFPYEWYGDVLPIEIRIRLGIYRLLQGREYLDEALGHFEWLEPENEEQGAPVHDFADLFLEAGKALAKASHHAQALRYLEPLKRIDALEDVAAWLAIAESSYICNKTDQAIDCYEAAKDIDEQCSEARVQLTKLYTDIGDKNKALQNGQEAANLRRHVPKSTERRHYERKDQRVAREAAERALKEAKKLAGPHAAFNFEASQTVWQANITEGRPSGLKRQRKEMRHIQRKKLSQLSEEEREKRRLEKVTHNYDTIVHVTQSMRDGDPQSINLWMNCASALTADFRTNRVFYPFERHVTFQGYDKESKRETFQKKWKKDKRRATHHRDTPTPDAANADSPLPSIESSVPTDYSNILFTAWLDIFLEYAFLLAVHRADKEECYRTINAALDCTVWYHEPDSMLQIYTVWFVCALRLRDGNTLFNVVARWFMRQYQFCTDTYRLFAALNLLFPYPNLHGGKDTQMLNGDFRQGPSQKFMFRQLKATDAMLPPDYDGGPDGPVPKFMREELTRIAREENDDRVKRAVGGFPGYNERHARPKQMDVVLLTLYAHLLYAAGSYPNALAYFYRAYTLDPKNAMVLLSMALSYTHQLFKRQNEDRHQWLLRGLAFFDEYAITRIEWAKGKDGERAMVNDGAVGEAEKIVRQEIEFNRARMWQMLGMGNLALRGYEKVVAMGSNTAMEVDKPDGDEGAEAVNEDFSLEAAYAMQTIYAVNGDMEKAKQITEKWLVIE